MTIECPDCGSGNVSQVKRSPNHLCHDCFATFTPGKEQRKANPQEPLTYLHTRGIDRAWTSSTRKAKCELRLDGSTGLPVAVVFKNSRGEEVYWPFSNWKVLVDKVNQSAKALRKKSREVKP